MNGHMNGQNIGKTRNQSKSRPKDKFCVWKK